MRNYSKILCAICAGLMTSAVATAANSVTTGKSVLEVSAAVQVKGKVVDSSGAPIIGATVMEVGTPSNGTLTGSDGTFTLSVNKGSSLSISYIGYKTATVRAVEGRIINVVLEEDSEMLNDVVVVGYGTQRKKLVTGATVHVDADNITAVNAVDAFGALQSLAAGMNIVQNSGQPGESYRVVIRGMGTAGSNEPLYVIDGVPGGNISDLSPNDIESIDVLQTVSSWSTPRRARPVMCR